MTSILNNKKFDVVIMNPPYQDPNNNRSPLWQKFIKKAFNCMKDGGFLCAVHPSAWRKPKHKLFPLFQKYNMCYLEIHNQKDGKETFGAGTRYDWYIIEKTKKSSSTIVLDEDGIEHIINLGNCACLPHGMLDLFNKLIAKENEEKCEILYSCSYHTQKKSMSKEKTEEFKYPCIHSTGVRGQTIRYSNIKKGDFGTSKFIMGRSSPECGIYDKDGQYGMTQDCFGIPILDGDDEELIKGAIKTDKFKKFLKATKWSGFATDWRMFDNFKKDFWKEFI